MLPAQFGVRKARRHGYVPKPDVGFSIVARFFGAVEPFGFFGAVIEIQEGLDGQHSRLFVGHISAGCADVDAAAAEVGPDVIGGASRCE